MYVYASRRVLCRAEGLSLTGARTISRIADQPRSERRAAAPPTLSRVCPDRSPPPPPRARSSLLSAQNTVVIQQVAGTPAGATRTARALFILYMFSALPISVIFTRALTVCGL